MPAIVRVCDRAHKCYNMVHFRFLLNTSFIVCSSNWLATVKQHLIIQLIILNQNITIERKK